jgi:hypothetical protein
MIFTGSVCIFYWKASIVTVVSALAFQTWLPISAIKSTEHVCCHSPFYRTPPNNNSNKRLQISSRSRTATKIYGINKKLSEADKDRLLLGEAGLTAFIVAEMRHFINETMVEFDQQLRYGTKWVMDDHEKIRQGLMDETTGNIVNKEYLDAVALFSQRNKTAASSNKVFNSVTEDDGYEDGGALAVELICNTTQYAFQEGFRQQGILSALGSAILFFRDYYRTPKLIAACERVGLSDYAVAHHITDMYHHRSFRGAYTKTLPPSGKGEIAARIAVGIDIGVDAAAKKREKKICDIGASDVKEEEFEMRQDVHEDDDECLVWSPTTPGVCLHWKSDEEAWRKKRFERVQMEGTRDPRRGGSGTTR